MRRGLLRAIVVSAVLVGGLASAACAAVLGIDEPEPVILDAGPIDSSLDGSPGPLGPSCRAIHQLLPEAGSGTYVLTSDGGTRSADCDMDSFDGGWTLVTPAMIVEDKTAEDYSPGTPARITIERDVDPRGGRIFTLLVTKQNCGADGGFKGPGHYFLVGELDDWTQIMATFAFSSDSACWRIFGDEHEDVSTNVVPFDPKVDLIGPQMNMTRTEAGVAMPFDGRTNRCAGEDAINFWSILYTAQPRTARVVMRRNAPRLPAGLEVNADCTQSASWVVSDIRVR